MAPTQLKKMSALNAFFPPAPTFTDANLPSQKGRVVIVTGAASGVGFELVKILYLAGGTVYIAARSTSRCEVAIQKLLEETRYLGTGKDGMVKGKLESMVVDLADLRTVKPAVESFLQKEERLDVLVHNAAVMTPPAGSKDKLGHDLEFGTNCLAPYLMTLLLEPILIRSVNMAMTTKGSVRIVWVTSMLREGMLPEEGIKFQADGTPIVLTKGMDNYMQSKVGDAWLADKFAKRLGEHGILSMSLHPGLMKTELQRHWPWIARFIMSVIFKSSVYGAYSELYAGFSPDVTARENGGHLMAWGRKAYLPSEVTSGLKSKAEGGTGAAQKFFEFCDRATKNFL